MTDSPIINTEENFFESLLEYLGSSRGFDFTQFKRNILKRRILKQMNRRGVDNFEDYRDYLEVHPDEFQSLFNTILINVTFFFRDQNAWAYLQEELLPAMLRAKSDTDSIRCWSAGCATGEEAYTIAIILAEILGIEAFQQRVKIYATDIDDDALNEARQARYTAKQLEAIPPDLQLKYFVASGDQEFTFRSDLRRLVIFGRHNLFKDAPISSVDLLCCRNTLIYFNANAQNFILKRFHFALNTTGFLVLGKAEMLLTQGTLFTPLNPQYRIFQCVDKKLERKRSLTTFEPYVVEDKVINHYRQLQELAFESDLNAQFIVDQHGDLVRVNQAARELFNLPIQEGTKPLNELEIYYRPLELRSLIDRVYQEKTSLKVKDLLYEMADGTQKYLDLHLNPLTQMNQNVIGVSITLIDVTESWEFRSQIERNNYEIQSTNEELKTTNEEIQSTNEELETTNEELQSSNEELETINEELQSTNTELENLNELFNQKTEEYNVVNDFLNAIFLSLRTAIVVLDYQLEILAWNTKAEDLWGLRADEVKGQSIFSLDFGLPIAEIEEPIRLCLNDGEQHQDFILSAVNRRGKNIECRVNLDSLLNLERQKFGVMIRMEEMKSS